MALFELPTLTETWHRMRAVGYAILPASNWNPRSYHGQRAKFYAAAVTQVIAAIRDMLENLFPTTARDDGGIDRWGNLHGIVRTDATPARKSAAGRVRGLAGTAVPVDAELVHQASGLRFKIENATVIAGSGSIAADIVAIDTGAQTRLLTGEKLSFLSTPPNLSGIVQLEKDLDEGGFDREAYGAYRKRVLGELGEPRAGGTQSDYVKWGLEQSGIANAYAYPNRAGLGTVDVVGLKAGSGAARILASGELADYVADIRELAPTTPAAAAAALRGLEVVADPQDVEMVLTTDGKAANAYYWTGGPLTVATWTVGTRTLEFTTARPSTMKAGHTIMLKGVAVAGSQDGREYKIEALGVAADEVILEEVPGTAPAATDLVYSGGPLVKPVRDAILAHLNGERVYAGKGRVPTSESSLNSTVGLELITEGVGPANPGGIYGEWIGGIFRGVLGAIAIGKAGVRNYDVITPALDYEADDPDFPGDAEIDLVTPRMVLVRGAT